MFTNVTYEPTQDASYHSMEGFSFSQIKIVRKKPRLFHGMYIAKPPRWKIETTPAMELGTKLHARLLEPDTFDARYPAAGRCEGVLKSGKNVGATCGKSATQRTNHGEWFCGVHSKGIDCHEVDCLTDEDSEKLKWMEQSCREDPSIARLIDCPGQVEYSLFGTHEATGLPSRSRLDKVCEINGGRLILDFKTFYDDPADERLVGNAAIARAYYSQASYYMDMLAALGAPAAGFAFVFVGTAPPYDSVLWFMKEQDLEIGRRHNDKAFHEIKRRLDSGDWHGDKFSRPNMPPNYLTFADWFYKQTDEAIDYSSDFSEYGIAESASGE